MRKGDISNELPTRIIVVSDVFLNVELTVKRRLGIIPIPKLDKKIRRDVLSYLYVAGFNRGFNFELASYELDDSELASLMEQLDNMGTNPFRYYASYDSVEHLVSLLPYRPEVTGVLDVPSNLLRYGHWGLDMGSL